MMPIPDSPWMLSLSGLLCGIFIGIIARKNHFCTLSSLERYWYADDTKGVRTWALAGVVALLLTQWLVQSQKIDVSSSFYLSTDFNLASAIVGGLLFGFGMALVGTCGFGALVRLGGGSLRSLIILCTMGFAALAASYGVIGQLRMLSDRLFSIDLAFAGSQSMADIASSFTGTAMDIPVTLSLSVGILFWIYKSVSYRRDIEQQVTGAGIGAAVAFGWWATSYFKNNLFIDVQIESASFVLPPGEIMMQFIVFTGRLPDYGMGLAVGIVLGSAITSVITKDVRWEACDSAQELGMHLIGAALMGIGGIFALGCTIGQGVSAFSLLAISAPIVLCSIVIGSRAGLSVLINGLPRIRAASS